MREITDIKPQRRKGRVSVFLDGEFAFGLALEVAEKSQLSVGQTISQSQIDALESADSLSGCLSAALRYLSYRPRSERETRAKLHLKGFDDKTIEGAISELKERGLIDDVAFARFWQEERETFSPRGRLLLKKELRGLGIESEIVEDITLAVNEKEGAYRAALRRARRLAESDYRTFCRKLGAFLKRRGFGYEVIDPTVKRMWEEVHLP